MPPVQPLLPVQQGSPGEKNRSGGGRPGSQHVSPAKELVAAVQQGDVEGALAAVSWACLRSPALLLVVVTLLMAAVGLAALLLPQQPLPGVLQHLSLRQAGEAAMQAPLHCPYGGGQHATQACPAHAGDPRMPRVDPSADQTSNPCRPPPARIL